MFFSYTTHILTTLCFLGNIPVYSLFQIYIIYHHRYHNHIYNLSVYGITTILLQNLLIEKNFLDGL